MHGRCDPAFERVREEFTRGFDELAGDAQRGEIGAALAISVEGRLVVDLWGGHADPARTRPWKRNTLANLYSTTKGISAVLIHRLVDEGRLDLEVPVSRYWPEFAAHGKGATTIGQLLSHRAGLPALRAPLPADAIYDGPSLAAALADEAPWWEPDECHGYHAFTFGWLLGELVARVTGRTLGTYLRESLAKPLSLDLHIGLPASEYSRTADLTALPAETGSEAVRLLGHALRDPGSATTLAFGNPPGMLAPGVANSTAWRSAEIPAANGHGTARALASLYGALASGGSLESYRVLSPESVSRCHREQARGTDAVLKMPTRFGAGFMLSDALTRFGRGPRAFGHPGAGGSLGMADPDSQVGFGYVPNRMGSCILLDPRPAALLDALYSCL